MLLAATESLGLACESLPLANLLLYYFGFLNKCAGNQEEMSFGVVEKP